MDNDSRNLLRAARRAAGVCPECPAPADPPHVRCRACRQKSSKIKRERVALGVCRFCPNPISPGHGMCADHLRRQREYTNARRAAARAKKESA